MRRVIKLVAILIPTIGLLACAGGGGGGSGGSAAATPFSSWASVGANSTVIATGNSVTFSNGNISIAGSGSSVTATFDGNRNVSAVTMSANGTTGTFNQGNGDVHTSYSYFEQFVSKDGKSIAIFVNPYDKGWNYQTFGVWGGAGDNLSSGNVSAISVGSITPVTGMPTTGTATFYGTTSGSVAGVVSGLVSFYSAPAALAVDFGSRTIGFASSGSVAKPVGSSVVYSAPGLDLRGTGSYGPGTSQFGGSIIAANGMTGSMVGQFYGPNAQEVGGTYALKNPSVGAMSGGFGGKR